MKKKILSLVLALLMASSSAALVAADETDAVVDETPVVTATEEEEESPYYYAVEFLNHYGIYKGTSASDLAIEEDIQRYQMALFVSRISTGWVDDEKWEDGPQNTSIFTDIDEGAASERKGAISYANQKGIIEGYGNGKFGPYDGITYQNALTMVVRTLGYQGLDWPWGYIEQAITLGLTEGITDVAYTDILTRGEVAQIIYNALFATTKSGSTLALEHFGIEFAWEPIVITASDLAIYEKDGKVSGHEQSNEEQKIVAFKLYNKDGGVEDETYYATAESLYLDATKHEDDLAVGSTMWVFFEKDADSNLVNIIDCRPNTVDEIWNMGRTDDEGVEQTYPIQEYLKNYTLVSKYTPINYVSSVASDTKLTKKLYPEIIVYNALAQLTVEKVDADKAYGDNLAIDWVTGDILIPCKKDEAKFTAKDGDKETYYKVAWYYNDTYDMYFRYTYDKEDKVIVGIEWMTDEKLEKTYKDAFDAVKKNVPVPGFNVPVTDGVGGSAYASLTLEDVDLDKEGIAERGIYEEYALGYFSVSTKKCTDCNDNKDHPSYKIEKVTVDLSTDGMGVKGTVRNGGYNIFSEVPCKHHNYKDVAWFADGYEPTKDEDGAYVNGYVIYSVDTQTNEIKIVKDITNGDDADSYVARGVLRAYSPDKQTVTIGERTFNADYNELKDTGFYKVKDNKAKYTAGLYSMFNQYVEYVVVDDKVVSVRLQGETTGKYLVVKGYAGLTNDNYIAIDAYSTADRALGTYCIGSYDGWKQGDYHYYLTEEKVKESFTPGTIYYIKSYDDANDVYYVELVGEHGWNKGEYEYVVEDMSLAGVTFNFFNDGYRKITNSDGTTREEKKMKGEDIYIIIPKIVSEGIGDRDKAPMYVYEGKVSDTDWTIKGDLVTTIGNNVYVVVNATEYTGFWYDSYQSGMVLYQGGKILEAGYDAALQGEGNVSSIIKDRYILGASVTTVEVLDLYTGQDTTVTDRNIDLKKNHVYTTVSKQVVEQYTSGNTEKEEINVVDFIWNMYYYYCDTNTDKYEESADYLFGYFTQKVSDGVKNDNLKTAVRKALVADKYYDYDRDRVGDVTSYIVEFPTVDTMKVSYKNDIAKYVKDNSTDEKAITAITCGYVYNVSSGKVVVYAMAGEKETTETLKVPTTLVTDVNGVTGVKVEQEYTFEVVKDATGKIIDATLTAVEYRFDGAKNMDHQARADAGLGFGYLSDHVDGTALSTEANKNGLTMNGATKVIADLSLDRNNTDVVKYDTYKCDDCDIIYSIKFVNLDKKVKTGDAFGLRMNLKVNALNEETGTVEPKDAAYGLWSTLTVGEKTITAKAGDGQKVFEGPFNAVNADAILDAVTADATID